MTLGGRPGTLGHWETERLLLHASAITYLIAYCLLPITYAYAYAYPYAHAHAYAYGFAFTDACMTWH